MRYQETENGIAKYDDSGKLIGIYSKSDPNVKEWRQQQGASQRRSTNKNTSSAVAKKTTTTTKPKYSESIGPKPQENNTPAKTTQRSATQTQTRQSEQSVGYQNYNRPWEQKLPEYARPGAQQRMLEKRTQPEFKEIRDTRDSVERGRQEVERVMLRKDRNGLPASTFNEQQFHDTSDIIIEMERLKNNPRDYYKKVDELGIDKANEWYRKNKNPYGMKKYDEFSRQADWAENVSPKELYKTIGEMAETGTGGNVRQFHEWKNKTGFGDTDSDRARIAIDVNNLSGNELDKYYEILYNDGLDSATIYAMNESGYSFAPPTWNEEDIIEEANNRYKTGGQPAVDAYAKEIDEWYNNEYQKSFQDAFDRYINDSTKNTDYNDIYFKQQMKASTGDDRKYYQKQLDTLNNYKYMMLNDPERDRKIRAGEEKTSYKNKKKNAEDIKLFDVLRLMADDYMNYNIEMNSLPLSQTEKETYNYLMATSEEEAGVYARALMAKYQQSEVDKEKQAAYKYAQKHPWLATGENVVSSLGAGLVSLPAYTAQTISEKLGGEHVPSKVLANSNPMLIRKNALQQGVLDTIDSEAGKFLYNAGVSTINNIAGVALYNKYYPLIMALNAAGEETHQGLERGISKDAALLNGAISGGIEYMTEKLFFDDVMDAVTKPMTKNSASKIRNLVRASLANTGSEFGEEFVGAIAQNVTDAILTGDKSQLNEIINKNIADGMNKDDAARDAMMQLFVWEPLQNGLAGAISGGVLGGGYHYSAMTQYGGEVVNSNIGDAILTRAMSAPEGTNTKQIANDIVSQLQSGKRVDNYTYGNLYAAMKEDGVKLTDEDMTATDKVNNLYLKNGGGVAGTVAASRLNWSEYQYLEELGKATGKNFVIQDFVEAKTENGKTYDLANGLVKNNDNNVVYISANSENPLLATAKHEIFHIFAGTKHGQEYIKNITKTLQTKSNAAYKAEIQKKKHQYAAIGETIKNSDAREEIAADAAWNMLSRYTDVAALTNKDVRLAKKIKGVVVDLLNAINGSSAKIEGVSGAVYDSMTKEQLQNIKRNFEMALGEESNLSETKYSFVGTNFDGRKIYKSNYSIGTPKNLKQNDIVNLVQNIWYKQPITLRIIKEDGTSENIEAKFNPVLDERSDLSKIAFGNRKGTASEKRMTLDLSSDLYQIATDSIHTRGKDETGKENPAHNGVNRWEYFVTNIIYEDESGNRTDCYVNIDVKRSKDGDYFYSFALEKGTAPQTLLAVVNDKSHQRFLKADDGVLSSAPNGEGLARKHQLQNDYNTEYSKSQEENFKNHLEPDITKALSKSEAKTEPDITKVLSGKKRSFKKQSGYDFSKSFTTGRKAELEAAVKSKGEYSPENEIADEDYPDWFFGTPTPTDEDAPSVIAQTEAERQLAEMSDAIRKVIGKKITYDNIGIRQIAKDFKKIYKSRASIERISTAIAEAYKAVAEVQNSEGEEIDNDKIRNMISLSEKAAKVIIDSSDDLDRTVWDANKPVRDFIRKNVFKVNESIKRKFPEGGYNSFDEFRKANAGYIKISYSKGTSVDTLYSELVDNFPEWFTNAPNSAEEQLVWIADVLQDMRNTLVNNDGTTYDEKVQMLGSDILSLYTDAVFDIGTQQNIISEIERRKRDTIKRYYSDKYLDKIERDKEREKASEDRQKLLRIAKWLKNKKTSEYYREQIDELIHNLDTESIGFIKKGYDRVTKNPDGTETVTHVMDKIDIEKLAEEYNKLKEENPNFIVNTAVERKIARLKNVQIADMEIEDVRNLIEVLSNLQTEIMNSDRLIKSNRAERASKIAHDTKKRLEVIKGTGDSAFKIGLSNFLTGHVGAVAAARKFVGYQKDSSFVAVVEELNDGQREASKIQQEANAMFEEFLKKKENKKFLSQIDKTYKDYGNGVIITPGMKISLALLSKNKNAAEHIQGGGMTIPNQKLLEKGNVKEAFNKGKTIQITQEQLIKIANDLTAQEKEFADLVSKLMNEYSKRKINETSLELYGYELANVTDYFPIRTNKVFIGTEVENLSQNGTLEGMGILKERKPGAYTPIVLESVMTVVNRHINDVSKFAGMAIPLRNFKLVYGSASYVPTFEFDNRKTEKLTDYSSLQHSLTSTWGSHAKEYFDNLIQDIDTGGRKSDKTYSKAIDIITGNIPRQALMMNLSVVMKQVAAYPTAGAVLGFKPLTQALSHRVTESDKELYNRITPVIWLREKGYSMREISDYMEGTSLSKDMPALLGWIQATDVAISYKICKAAEMYVNSNYDYAKGSKAWEKALADTINAVIERTQQSSTTMQRAAVLRSPNELVKMFNLFKSQSYLQLELMLDAMGEYNAWRADKKAGREISDDDIKDSRRRLANVLSAQIVASATMSAIEIIYRAAILGRRDWEDEEGKFSASELAKVFLTSIIKDTAGMIQFGNEISDLLYSMLTGEKYYGIDVATASLISNAFDGILKIADNTRNIVDVLRGKKQFDINELLMPTMKSLEKIVAVGGIPMANIRKNIQGIYNLTTAALQKFNPSAAKKIDEAVTNFFYGSTAVFEERKKEVYEKQKLSPENYEANYERKKYEKANLIVNTLEKYADTKRSTIKDYVKQYHDAMSTMTLSPDAEKVFKKLYSKLYSNFGKTVAKQSLPFYTPAQELNVEYGGDKIKYKLNADEYIEYVKNLVNEDLKVFESLAKDEYFLEQSPEVQLKILKKQRDNAISEFETKLVISKVGASEQQKTAEQTKKRDRLLSMQKTPGKDYVKLGDIYYEVTPETYAKYKNYISAKTQKIIDILNEGTPLDYIEGFEDVYFYDEDGEKIEIDMPLEKYDDIIKSKVFEKVENEVKNSFENEIAFQGKTQKNITKEIMDSKYRYYKDNDIVKKIGGGDLSEPAWVRSTDKNIVHEMNEDDYIEEVPIDKSYNIVDSAMKYIGTPYKCGGTKKETGFDCSGLMQCVFAENGIKINRTAREQFKNGTPVEYNNLKKGDLVFFKGSTGTASAPGHVGLYIGNGQFLHAPQTGDVVKTSDLDKRKDYVGARRIIE